MVTAITTFKVRPAHESLGIRGRQLWRCLKQVIKVGKIPPEIQILSNTGETVLWESLFQDKRELKRTVVLTIVSVRKPTFVAPLKLSATVKNTGKLLSKALALPSI